MNIYDNIKSPLLCDDPTPNFWCPRNYQFMRKRCEKRKYEKKALAFIMVALRSERRRATIYNKSELITDG
jgi:hypothetical protein